MAGIVRPRVGRSIGILRTAAGTGLASGNPVIAAKMDDFFRRRWNEVLSLYNAHRDDRAANARQLRRPGFRNVSCIDQQSGVLGSKMGGTLPSGIGEN